MQANSCWRSSRIRRFFRICICWSQKALILLQLFLHDYVSIFLYRFVDPPFVFLPLFPCFCLGLMRLYLSLTVSVSCCRPVSFSISSLPPVSRSLFLPVFVYLCQAHSASMCFRLSPCIYTYLSLLLLRLLPSILLPLTPAKGPTL